MKKLVLYVASVLIVASVAAAPGSELLQSFNKTFPNAKDVKWRDDKAGYFVSFYQNENFNKVFYNKEGDFVYSLKYFKADELPVNIKMLLNKKFSTANIIGVTEATTQGNTMYNIKLTTNDKLYCLNVLADGTITKQERYNNDNSGSSASK